MFELVGRARQGRLDQVGGADEELVLGAGGLEEACLLLFVCSIVSVGGGHAGVHILFLAGGSTVIKVSR